MLENRASGEFAYWRNGSRLIIATWDFSYLVVLERRTRVVILITAYIRPQRHSQAKLKKQYGQADEQYTTAV